MGMDQCLTATDEPMSSEALWEEKSGWYWRKNYHLMEFFASRANYVDFDDEGDFDDGTLEVTAALLDELEAVLNSEAGLPHPRNGEWFHIDWVSSSFLERTPESAAYDLGAVQWARERLNEGKRIYYLVSY